MTEKTLKSWEHPNCPSGELEEILDLAEKFRAAQQAPAIRADHFLLAYILYTLPFKADAVLKVFEQVRDEWKASLH